MVKSRVVGWCTEGRVRPAARRGRIEMLGSGVCRATVRRGMQTASQRYIPLGAGESKPMSSIVKEFKQYPNAEMSVLSNNVRVVTEHVPGALSTVGIWLDSGSRYETAEENGVAHFLEHLLFKGTKTRTQTQLEEGVENMGGNLNAYTSREQTAYFGTFLNRDVKAGIELIADLFRNSTITEGSVERERSVILREMEAVEGDTMEVIFDFLHHTAYRDDALGRTILGTQDQIRSITRDHLTSFMKKHYTGDRMVIVGAGDVKHDDLVNYSQSLFGDIAPHGEGFSLPEARFIGSDYRHRNDSDEHADVAVAFRTDGIYSDHFWNLFLLKEYFGAWDDKMQFGAQYPNRMMNVMDGNEACTKYQAFFNHYKDTGLFGIYTTSGPYQAADAVKKSVTEMARIGSAGVCPVTMGVAQRKLLRDVYQALGSSTMNVADDVGYNVLAFGSRMHPAEFAERIASITPSQLSRTGGEFFYDQDLAVAALGSIYEVPDYNSIRSYSG